VEDLKSLALQKKAEDFLHSCKSNQLDRSLYLSPRKQAAPVPEEYECVIPHQEYDGEHFLDLPSDNDVWKCYHEFYMATLNSALKMAVCAICARQLSVHDDDVTTIPLHDLHKSHWKHNLHGGRLLEPTGIALTDSDICMVQTCCQCYLSLEKNILTSLLP